MGKYGEVVHRGVGGKIIGAAGSQLGLYCNLTSLQGIHTWKSFTTLVHYPYLYSNVTINRITSLTFEQ